MALANYVDKFPEVRVAYMAFLWNIKQVVEKKKPRVDLRTAGKNKYRSDYRISELINIGREV